MSERCRSGRGSWIAVIAIALFTAYLLAIGPLVWAERHGLLVEPFKTGIGMAYYPIRLLSEKSSLAHDWIYWYADLWAKPVAVP